MCKALVESGQVYFQARTYVIRRGSLDFVNPRKLEPLFDIEALRRSVEDYVARLD